jgi:3-oxoacyl-[acyl-carrier protein] reductase
MPHPAAQNRGVALITGAAGGLGRALVAEFAAQGWRVAAGWHRQPPDPSVGPPAAVWPVPLDVTDAGAIATAVAVVTARWGAVGLLINNAGVIADALLGQMSDGDWDRVQAVNLRGAFLLCRAVLPAMIRQRQGHVVNIASLSARQGSRGQANYAAAKAGLIGLTQALAREVGPQNIRVNAVLPGFLLTPMTGQVARPVMAAAQAANVLGRLNTVDEVARFVAFLATLEGVSGQVFQLDSRIGRWT